MKQLSETELKAIQDRFEATTQGEWKRHPNHRYWVLLPLPEGAVNLRDEADAQFCAHAHQDVPALLAEIARLKALTQWQPIETAPKYRGEILARDIHDDIWLVLWEEDRWVTLTPVGISNIEIPDLVDYILIPELPEPPEVTP